MLPALAGGYLVTLLLSASFGETLVTLVARVLFTGSVVALIHGLCTRFRCFQEAGRMILQNFHVAALRQKQLRFNLRCSEEHPTL